MPTQTFWSLPEEKRQTILELAIEEFATNNYEQASISRIVARAGIAKGSFYQYFADKQELFLYLLEYSNQQRLAFVQQHSTAVAEAGFFTTLRQQMSVSARAALAYPQLTQLFYRAIESRLPFHAEALSQMQRMASGHMRQLLLQGIARGDLAADLDVDVAAAVVSGMLRETSNLVLARLQLSQEELPTVALTRFDSPAVERLFDNLIRVLEHGLGRKDE